MHVQPDPVPPRHTFDDDESTDEDDGENDVDHPLQVSGYQDAEDEQVPKTKKMELGVANVSLTGEIKGSSTVVIGVDMLHGVDGWFHSPSTEVGNFSTEVEGHHTNPIPIKYHEEEDIYTLSIAQQPALQVTDALATKILETLHPTNLIILTSSKSVPHTHPVSLLRTSHPLKGVGGIPVAENPLFSNRGRVTRERLAERRAAAHLEIPLLQPPNMIQGIAASVMALAEVHGIHAVCFVVSEWVGEQLEDGDVEKIVHKLNEVLSGEGSVSVGDVRKTWRQAFESSGAQKASIYL